MTDIGKATERLSARSAVPAHYGWCLVVFAWMLLDFIPRFFQGDSITYLLTGERSVPLERSWAFGFAANFIVRHTHGYGAFMLIQIGMLAGLIAAARLFFSGFGRSTVVYGVIAVLLALDPLLEIHTRFVMTDLSSVCAFFAALLALFFLLRDGVCTRSLWLLVALVIASTVAAVFLRVAYALIIELTVVLAGLFMTGRLARRQWLALAAAALGPVIAVGSLAVANQSVFGNQFQHQPFVNKLSGIFLASIFAPALAQSDFAKVGIPITTAEFLQLDLGNYEKRSTHLWGRSHDDLHQFIKDKLGIQQSYTTEVDRAASGLVRSALHRKPIAMARVYGWNVFQYANPSEWTHSTGGEMGYRRPLPADFVAWSNQHTVLKIEPETTLIRSALIRAYEAVAGLYPLQLLLGLAAAAYLLMRRRNRPVVAVLTAALLADLAAAPLYSLYPVARFVLGAIIVSYLLIGLAIQAVMTRTPCAAALADAGSPVGGQ